MGDAAIGYPNARDGPLAEVEDADVRALVGPAQVQPEVEEPVESPPPRLRPVGGLTDAHDRGAPGAARRRAHRQRGRAVRQRAELHDDFSATPVVLDLQA